MEKFIGRFAPHAYALLRVIAGLMFAMHGSQKLFGWPGGGEPAGVMLMKIAGVIELAGGLLIAFGLFTSIAAFICSGEMAYAYFSAHAPQSFWPLLNQGEVAVLYCFLFLFMAAHGSGIFSVDAARRARAMNVKYEPAIYALLRAVAGLMFAMHGTAKLWGWPGDRPPAADLLRISAGWIEVVCGVMIAVGFLAGWAAFLASGTMAFAYFMRHHGVGEIDAFWPVVNRGEAAVLYCFLWLYVAARGGITWRRRDTTTQS